MPLAAADPAHVDELRAELRIVLQSPLFARSPGLSHLLSYLCEKAFSGETAQVKEYSIALDVFGREPSFDQDSDSIVRVQANRLRKRLGEYYAAEGANDPLQITIPIGQYVPVFEEHGAAVAPAASRDRQPAERSRIRLFSRQWIWIGLVTLAVASALVVAYFLRQRPNADARPQPPPVLQTSALPPVGLPVGDEIRILAGSIRSYVDRSGKLWNPDQGFTGGAAVHTSVQHIWRTQDASIYRNSRQGDFRYDLPLKPGLYELHLHFAETFYGPEDAGGGGEGSRIMSITANDKPLLSNFDVIGDAGGGRTADVKIFTDVAPSPDGLLHLNISSITGRGMLSAIEILPGYRGHIRPVRIVARDVPYYSNDSRWWSSDAYFKGGQLAASEEPASGTDDTELYETERWGHFSYSLPVVPGRYAITLHFIERGSRMSDGEPELPLKSGAPARLFDVYCNGRVIVSHLDLRREVGTNRALLRKISDLEPNAQGKLLLEFVPVNGYATVSAIEVIPQ
jgi:hypothetical protein